MKIKCITPPKNPTPFLAKCSMNLKNLLAQGDEDPKTTSKLKNVFKQTYMPLACHWKQDAGLEDPLAE